MANYFREVLQLGAILLIVYVAIGYWAVGQTFLGQPLLGDYRTLQSQKVLCAIFLGWLIIPIVIIQHILKGRR